MKLGFWHDEDQPPCKECGNSLIRSQVGDQNLIDKLEKYKALAIQREQEIELAERKIFELERKVRDLEYEPESDIKFIDGLRLKWESVGIKYIQMLRGWYKDTKRYRHIDVDQEGRKQPEQIIILEIELNPEMTVHYSYNGTGRSYKTSTMTYDNFVRYYI